MLREYVNLHNKFDVCKSVHHHTIQTIQPTICSSFTSLLLDVYGWLNMFRASSRPSSGAYNCTRSLWFYRWTEARDPRSQAKSIPVTPLPRISVTTEQHKRSPVYNLIEYLKILSNLTSVYTNYSLRGIFTVWRRVEGGPIDIPTLHHRQSKCLPF
jgi:hypothetical protein